MLTPAPSPSCKGIPNPCVPQALAFLGCVQLGKRSKLNQKSLLRRGPVTSFAALLLKFQKGHSDNKKYTQFLVKLMSCCCLFRETLIPSQRAGVSLSRARGAELHLLTGVQPPTESAAELQRRRNPFPALVWAPLCQTPSSWISHLTLPREALTQDAGRSLQTRLHFTRN